MAKYYEWLILNILKSFLCLSQRHNRFQSGIKNTLAFFLISDCLILMLCHEDLTTVKDINTLCLNIPGTWTIFTFGFSPLPLLQVRQRHTSCLLSVKNNINNIFNLWKHKMRTFTKILHLQAMKLAEPSGTFQSSDQSYSHPESYQDRFLIRKLSTFSLGVTGRWSLTLIFHHTYSMLNYSM